MREITTEADYTDIFGTDADFEESHCFTYVQTVPPEELLGELKALRVTAGPAVTGLSALREWTIEYCRGGSHPDDLLHVMRKVGFGPMEDPDADEDEVKSLTPASSPWRTTSPESG